MQTKETSVEGRRKWLLRGMASAVAASFGALTGFAFAFLLPRRERAVEQRIFLGFASTLGAGESRLLTLPSGERMVLANTGRSGGAGETFQAFSSRCPHLGCQVHYEAGEDRYLCPCHQGVFDKDGKAVSGPPAKAGQQLAAYRIEADGNSLYAVIDLL